jgi:hypothetical protein
VYHRLKSGLAFAFVILIFLAAIANDLFRPGYHVQ